MNYRELIAQSWQIVRHNKRIWFFSFWSTVCSMVDPIFTMLIRSPILKTSASLFLPLFGLVLILSAAYTIIFFWSLYGVSYSTALAVNGVECEVIGVWNSFKSNFLKLVFLGIFVVIYALILYGLNNLVWKVIISLASNLYGSTFWWSLGVGFFMLLFGAPITLSFYGLIFQKMGAFASFLNGIGVFSKDPTTFVGIGLMAFLVVLVSGLVTLISLSFLGQAISYENYNSMNSAAPIHMFISFLWFFVSPISATAYASHYFKISPIRE